LFLAFIITAGTITAFYPSSSLFITDAYAIKDIEKEKIECNNINLNLNGLDIDAVPEPLRILLQDQGETEETNSGTDTFGMGEEKRFGYNDKDFSLVCINNNYNEFIVIPTPSTPPTPPIPPPTGLLDLAIANQDSDNVSILLGDGDGTFTQAADSPITVGDAPRSVAVGDFN